MTAAARPRQEAPGATSGGAGEVWRDAGPWLAVLLALGLDAGIQESYFQLGAETIKLILLGLSLAISVFMLWRYQRGYWRAPTPRTRRWWSAIAVGLMLPLHSATSAWFSAASVGWTLGKTVLIAVALGVLFMQAGPWSWSRVRTALAVAMVVFAASGPLLALQLARPVDWPGVTAPTAASRDATVVVLLDELNWRASDEIVQAIRDSGLSVRAKPLRPIGDATARVVPQMFTRERFPLAAPCLPSALCSGSQVLDFHRVALGNVPVDVVGFYHPYCAIPGLRSCLVSRPDAPTFDLERWRCAVVRRQPGWFGDEEGRHCAMLPSTVASAHLQRLLMALDHAPIWTQGGLLFAHLPLPHPPGVTGAGTLSEQYHANVGVAVGVVRQLVQRLRAGHFDHARLVIFSDHPLRPGVWCGLAGYAHNGCPLPAADLDTEVPLIAAGFGDWTIFERMATNADVFDMIKAH